MTNEEKAGLVIYKLDKARNTIAESALLIKNKMWNAAVSRVYYACFYAVSALLAYHEIKARKHAGVIQMFGLHFINTGIITKEAGKFYSIVFDMRQSGDYTDYFIFEEQEVTGLSTPPREFIDQIERSIPRQ